MTPIVNTPAVSVSSSDSFADSGLSIRPRCAGGPRRNGPDNRTMLVAARIPLGTAMLLTPGLPRTVRHAMAAARPTRPGRTTGQTEYRTRKMRSVPHRTPRKSDVPRIRAAWQSIAYDLGSTSSSIMCASIRRVSLSSIFDPSWFIVFSRCRPGTWEASAQSRQNVKVAMSSGPLISRCWITALLPCSKDR
jgi:hypothetical protein